MANSSLRACATGTAFARSPHPLLCCLNRHGQPRIALELLLVMFGDLLRTLDHGCPSQREGYFGNVLGLGLLQDSDHLDQGRCDVNGLVIVVLMQDDLVARQGRESGKGLIQCLSVTCEWVHNSCSPSFKSNFLRIVRPCACVRLCCTAARTPYLLAGGLQKNASCVCRGSCSPR